MEKTVCSLETGTCSSDDLTLKIRGKSLLNTLGAGVSAYQGSRCAMEDVFMMRLWADIEKDEEDEPPAKIQRLDDNCNKKLSFFAVCDGHGGSCAAEYVCENLMKNITSQRGFRKETESSILKGFAATENSFLELVERKEMDGMLGTTVTMAIVIGHDLYVANVGDSEAVLCSKGKPCVLTQVHIPSDPLETERIKNEGGLVMKDREGNMRLGHPVWNPNYVNLGVSRAIGDMYFKTSEFVGTKCSGLSAVPSVTKRKLTADDEFMIIASDGFWDVVKHGEAVEFVRARMASDSNQICKELIDLCQLRRSQDNITVLLVKFEIQYQINPSSGC